MTRLAEGSKGRNHDIESRSLRVRDIPPGTEEPIVQQAFEKFAKVRMVAMEPGASEARIEFENAAVRLSHHSPFLLLFSPSSRGETQSDWIVSDVSSMEIGSGQSASRQRSYQNRRYRSRNLRRRTTSAYGGRKEAQLNDRARFVHLLSINRAGNVSHASSGFSRTWTSRIKRESTRNWIARRRSSWNEFFCW